MTKNIEVSQNLHFHRMIGKIPAKAMEFGFYIISGQVNWQSQTYMDRISERRFEFYSLSHMIGGKGRLYMNGQTVELYPGDAVLICPGDWHCYGRYDEELYVEDSIQFCGRLADILRKFGVLRSGILQMGAIRSLIPIIEKSRSAEPESWLEAALELQMLLLSISRGDKKKTPIELLLETIHTSPVKRWWSVNELAELFGGSKDRLRREFLKHTGMLPKHYLEQLKLRQAAEELSTSAQSVTETAFRFGYVDRYHFSRRFKNFFGVSPEQFRKQIKKNEPPVNDDKSRH